MTRLRPIANLVLVSLSMVCFVGCFGGEARVPAPEINAEIAAKGAMEAYDSNADGEIDETEMKACPSFVRALDEIDENSDGALSLEEIQARLDYMLQGRDGRMSLSCLVTKGNSPMPGAMITFVPEVFMADMIESATGTTNRDGQANIHIQDNMGGLQPGFYKVEISRKSSSGKESISKKYNVETRLGQEVTSGSKFLANGLVFKM